MQPSVKLEGQCLQIKFLISQSLGVAVLHRHQCTESETITGRLLRGFLA